MLVHFWIIGVVESESGFAFHDKFKFFNLGKFLVLITLLVLSSCRIPDSIGFYQPITMSLQVPDGPPEYKAGWYAGCRTALANKAFANAFVYQDGKGPDFGSGVYQHDPMFQTGWGQGWFACVLHIGQFVGDPSLRFHSFAASPLE